MLNESVFFFFSKSVTASKKKTKKNYKGKTHTRSISFFLFGFLEAE